MSVNTSSVFVLPIKKLVPLEEVGAPAEEVGTPEKVAEPEEPKEPDVKRMKLSSEASVLSGCP